jgi:hypothetical protein
MKMSGNFIVIARLVQTGPFGALAAAAFEDGCDRLIAQLSNSPHLS